MSDVLRCAFCGKLLMGGILDAATHDCNENKDLVKSLDNTRTDGDFERGEKEGFKKAVEMLRGERACLINERDGYNDYGKKWADFLEAERSQEK